ncbi:hypothetical protein HD596_000504 [Nonomuraea jabiensis]|uniref:Uncharacterized protein n=1 Tax=Nonomuraea jabiensis TaxID=882448 RepID=A0A7W9FY83_9ACTN|nr:hypothetical protein [Nonomuraea jabiensis]
MSAGTSLMVNEHGKRINSPHTYRLGGGPVSQRHRPGVRIDQRCGGRGCGAGHGRPQPGHATCAVQCAAQAGRGDLGHNELSNRRCAPFGPGPVAGAAVIWPTCPQVPPPHSSMMRSVFHLLGAHPAHAGNAT